MLTPRPGGGFIAGPLDVLILLRHQTTGRFHPALAEDITIVNMEGPTPRLTIQYKLHHTSGGATESEGVQLLIKMRGDLAVRDGNVCVTPLVWGGEKFRETLPNWTAPGVGGANGSQQPAAGGLEAALLTRFRRWHDDVTKVERICSASRYEELVEITAAVSPIPAASYAIAHGVQTADQFWHCRERLHVLLDQILASHLAESGRPLGLEILDDLKAWPLMLAAGSCEGCDGSGIRPDATAHAGPPPAGFTVVERCDSCDRFATDLIAALAWGLEAQEQSGQGTTQAIARKRPLRGR